MNRPYLYATIFLILPLFLMAQPEEDSITWSIDLADVVVTAQYAPTASEEAVHDITVIKAEALQSKGFNNLSEVLSQQVNLQVDTDPILGNGLNIQGVGGENVQIMIDGVPVIGRVDGAIDLSQINLQDVRQIEIVKGALSAQYGSNAAGGVINIITNKSQRKPWKLGSLHHYESLDIHQQQLALGSRFNRFYVHLGGNYYQAQFAPVDSLRLYETVVLESGESYRSKKTPWNPKKQFGLNGKLRYNPNDSTSLTYQYRYFNEEVALYGEVRRPQFQPYAFDETYTTLRQDHSLQMESWLTPSLYLQSTTAFNHYERLGASLRRDMSTDTTSLIENGGDSTLFNALLHRTILSTSRDKSWNTLLGMEIQLENASGQRIRDDRKPPLNRTERGNFAFWTGLRLDLTAKLKIESNLRYGYNTDYRHPLIPALNLAWTPSEKWTFRGSYAHGFRAPSLKELRFNFVDVNHYIVGNPSLKAEHSKNATVAVDFKPNSSDSPVWRLRANLFFNDIRNRIVLAEYETLRFNYQNLDRFQTHGFNLQALVSWSKDFSLSSNFAFTRLYNTLADEKQDPRFSNLPEMQNELQVALPLINTRLIILHRYIGRQVRFYQNEQEELAQGYIGRYHMINASLSRKLWSDRIALSAGVKNLLDRSTVSLTGNSAGGTHNSNTGEQLIGFGRSFFIRLQMNLEWN